jgi:hypothetical protein
MCFDNIHDSIELELAYTLSIQFNKDAKVIDIIGSKSTVQ